MKNPLIPNEHLADCVDFVPIDERNWRAKRRLFLFTWFVFVVFVISACAIVFFQFAYLARRHRDITNDDLGFDVNEFELDEQEYASRFFHFVFKYGRKYDDRDESNRRFHVYIKNMKDIDLANRLEDADFDENEFADWTDEEFKKILHQHGSKHTFPLSTSLLDDFNPPKLEGAPWLAKIARPDEFDWRAKNVVTPVKNQGNCGSCWAFATVATVESAYAIKTGQLVSLSEQELLDCDDRDSGCDGGYRPYAFQFVQEHGLTTETNYPYCAEQKDTCSPYNATVKIDRVINLGHDEEYYADYLFQHGPFSIGMNVTKTMKSYRSGVFNPSPEDCAQESIGSHALLVVGYGSLNGVPYWLVKNSWGQSWGMQNGYFYLKRGVNSCGAALETYTVAIDK